MPRDELHLWAESQFQKVCHKANVLPMRHQSLTVVLGLSSDGLFVAAVESPALPHDVITALDGVHVPLLLIRGESDEKGCWYQLQSGGKYMPLEMERKPSEPKCCDITPRLARAIVGAIHDDQQRQLRERIGKSLRRLLEFQFSRDDLYLYELLQNATDDGATKISFDVNQEANALVVQHNGRPFHAADVLGLANVCLSTKRGRTIGFMGIGFKTVYKRFAEVTCSDDLWHFRFERPTNERDSSWKMLPKWADDALPPDKEFSCRFTLAEPREGAGLIDQDMSKLPDSVPPLLARRVLLQQPQQDWRLKWGSRDLSISLEDDDAERSPDR